MLNLDQCLDFVIIDFYVCSARVGLTNCLALCFGSQTHLTRFMVHPTSIRHHLPNFWGLFFMVVLCLGLGQTCTFAMPKADLAIVGALTSSKTLFTREYMELVGTPEQIQRQLYRVVLGEKVPKLGLVDWQELNKANQYNDADDSAPSISSLTKQNATANNSLELNYLLSVDGLAVFRSALVMNGLAFENWGDYVFQPDYKLPALDTVEAFVKREKHLPGIPTAKEIQQGGLDLALIAKENTKKIEELFLYVIELKKENDALKAKVTALENQK